MKTTLLLFAVVILSVLNLVGQTNLVTATAASQSPGQADLRRNPSDMSAERLQSMVAYQTSLANRVVGVLPKLQQADNPFQLINPFAPARYGSAYDNVMIDPLTGRVDGIILFGIRF